MKFESGPLLRPRNVPVPSDPPRRLPEVEGPQVAPPKTRGGTFGVMSNVERRGDIGARPEKLVRTKYLSLVSRTIPNPNVGRVAKCQVCWLQEARM